MWCLYHWIRELTSLFDCVRTHATRDDGWKSNVWEKRERNIKKVNRPRVEAETKKRCDDDISLLAALCSSLPYSLIGTLKNNKKKSMHTFIRSEIDSTTRQQRFSLSRFIINTNDEFSCSLIFHRVELMMPLKCNLVISRPLLVACFVDFLFFILL